MKTIVTAAAIIIAGTFSAAASSNRDAPVPQNYGEKIERPAATVFSDKELVRRGLERNAPVIVTKVPTGPVEVNKSGR